MVAGPALVAVLFLAPEISIEQVPPPAEKGSLQLEVPAASTVWVSPPLEVDATAAGLSWEDAPAEAWIRASADGTKWGPWVALHADPDHGPDPGGAEAAAARDGSDPVWVGKARFIQYRIEGRGDDLHAEYVETAGRNLSAWERVKLFVSRIAIGRRAPAVAQPDQPAMVSRQEWGGDACLAGQTPERDYADRVQMLFIHHTDHGSNSNGYGPGEGKDLVYAICSYHVNVREWSDIGYNFLVDKYGTIYEGRGGGIEAGVIGAHTGGFNSYSTGIAFIGDHTASAPTDAAQATLRRLASWKLDMHHVDPLGTVTVESYGSTRYPEGTIVQFPTVAGHRDASVTACPGGACYALLDWFKSGITAEGGPKIYGGWPDQDPRRRIAASRLPARDLRSSVLGADELDNIHPGSVRRRIVATRRNRTCRFGGVGRQFPRCAPAGGPLPRQLHGPSARRWRSPATGGLRFPPRLLPPPVRRRRRVRTRARHHPGVGGGPYPGMRTDHLLSEGGRHAVADGPIPHSHLGCFGI